MFKAEAAADSAAPPAKKVKVTARAAAKDTSVGAKQTGKRDGVASQADVQDPADQKKKKKRKSSTSADGSGKPAAASEGEQRRGNVMCKQINERQCRARERQSRKTRRW